MRVPLSWLREYAPLPEPVDATEVSRRLTAAGLEVESLESVGHDIRGVVVAQVLLDRGADRPEEADQVLPGRRLREPAGRAARRGVRRHLRRGQLRRRRPGRARAARRGAARRVRDRRAQDLRPHLRGDDLLGQRAGHRRRSLRHPRAARRRAAGRGFRVLREPARRGVRDRGDARPRLRRVGARHRARARQRVRRAVPRSGRDRAAGCDPARRRARLRGPGRLPGPHRRPDRLRPVRAARGARLLPVGAAPRCGCGCGWPGAGSAACRSRWT